MKPKEFVKTLRQKLEPEIINYLELCKNEAPGIFSGVDLKEFIKIGSNTYRGRFNLKRRIVENIELKGWLEFEIDGAYFKIANMPTAISYVYRHASRAL